MPKYEERYLKMEFWQNVMNFLKFVDVINGLDPKLEDKWEEDNLH